MKKPELLLPAGTLKNMRYAYAFGADAIYAGQPRYSLRARNNDFCYEKLQLGIKEAHQQGKHFFLASNVIPHNSKIKTYMHDLAPVIDLKPDALIMADPGLIMMVRERWPDIPVHLSVQANTVNYAAVKFWQSIGLSRIILSRELGLDEIEEIRQQCPDIELEVFIHGALCIAYSGRCLLSGYFNHRDPNQGTCTNACRWEYKLEDSDALTCGDVVKKGFDPFSEIDNPPLFSAVDNVRRHPAAEKVYLLEEKERPNELMPVYEDENGTYIMNSKDLRALEHIPRLMQIGVDSLKVEGRTKSHYYVARTAQVYRRAIDLISSGEELDMSLFADLNNLANRGYTDGFYQRHHTQDYQNYLDNHSSNKQQQFVAEIVEEKSENGKQYVLAEVKNRFAVGDNIEIISPEGNFTHQVEPMISNRKVNQVKQGDVLQEAPGSGHQVWLDISAMKTRPKNFNHALIAVNFK